MNIQHTSLCTLLAMTVACDAGDKTITVTNREPSIAFTSPSDGAAFDEMSTVSLYGIVDDDGPLEDLSLQWSSSIDGILPDFDIPDANGNVQLHTASLSEGIHVISLQATDSGALQGEAILTIEIMDVPDNPSVVIWYPQPDGAGLNGQEYVFMAEVSDRQEAAENLRVDIIADPGGPIPECLAIPVDGTGFAQCSAILELGTYSLQFKATDSDGNEGQAFVTYSVVDRMDYDGDGDDVTPNGGDCNDANATIYPGAPELCDNLDNDCNPLTGIDHGSECYDDDGDGYCEVPPCVNTPNVESDCNDANVDQSPIDPEVVNGQDDNCDGRIDEGTVVYDDDNDGYCETPPCVNTTRTESDCDDNSYAVNPAQLEICGDGLDNDCSGSENQQNAIGCTDFFQDADGDGYGVFGQSQCWCEASAPYSGVNSNDCLDTNADVYPNNPNYYAFHRGDGTYDYNCNGAEEKQYVGLSGGCQWGSIGGLSCETNSYGWQSVVPSCGMTGYYINDCDYQLDYLYLVGCAGVSYLTGQWTLLLGCLQSGGGTCNAQYSSSINEQTCR